MTVAASIQKTMNLGGITFNQSSAPTGDGMIVHSVSIAPADAGNLTTRTDDDTGIVTVDDSGHSFVELDRVDVYWSGGCRRGMDVGTVSGSTVAIDGGSGDNLPVEDTEVTIMEPIAFDVSLLGTNAVAILLATAKLGQFTFCASDDTEHFQKELGEGDSYEWHSGNGTTNPITGDQIDIVYVSHGDTAAVTMKVGVLYDND